MGIGVTIKNMVQQDPSMEKKIDEKTIFFCSNRRHTEKYKLKDNTDMVEGKNNFGSIITCAHV